MGVEMCFPRESCQVQRPLLCPKCRGHCSAEGRAQLLMDLGFGGLLAVCHMQMGRGLGPAPPESLGTQHQGSGEARKEVGVLVDPETWGLGHRGQGSAQASMSRIGFVAGTGHCELREGRCRVCPVAAANFKVHKKGLSKHLFSGRKRG